MNAVDITVVILIILLVLSVLFFRFILPRILHKRIKKKGKDESCGCGTSSYGDTAF